VWVLNFANSIIRLFLQAGNFSFTVMIALKYEADYYNTRLKMCCYMYNGCDMLMNWNRLQAIFSTQMSRLNIRVAHVGFVVDIVAQGQLLQFSPAIILSLFHSYLSLCVD
jgi:hypothetical protein